MPCAATRRRRTDRFGATAPQGEGVQRGAFEHEVLHLRSLLPHAPGAEARPDSDSNSIPGCAPRPSAERRASWTRSLRPASFASPYLAEASSGFTAVACARSGDEASGHRLGGPSNIRLQPQLLARRCGAPARLPAAASLPARPPLCAQAPSPALGCCGFQPAVKPARRPAQAVQVIEAARPGGGSGPEGEGHSAAVVAVRSPRTVRELRTVPPGAAALRAARRGRRRSWQMHLSARTDGRTDGRTPCRWTATRRGRCLPPARWRRTAASSCGRTRPCRGAGVPGARARPPWTHREGLRRGSASTGRGIPRHGGCAASETGRRGEGPVRPGSCVGAGRRERRTRAARAGKFQQSLETTRHR